MMHLTWLKKNRSFRNANGIDGQPAAPNPAELYPMPQQRRKIIIISRALFCPNSVTQEHRGV